MSNIRCDIAHPGVPKYPILSMIGHSCLWFTVQRQDVHGTFLMIPFTSFSVAEQVHETGTSSKSSPYCAISSTSKKSASSSSTSAPI